MRLLKTSKETSISLLYLIEKTARSPTLTQLTYPGGSFSQDETFRMNNIQDGEDADKNFITTDPLVSVQV